VFSCVCASYECKQRTGCVSASDLLCRQIVSEVATKVKVMQTEVTQIDSKLEKDLEKLFLKYKVMKSRPKICPNAVAKLQAHRLELEWSRRDIRALCADLNRFIKNLKGLLHTKEYYTIVLEMEKEIEVLASKVNTLKKDYC